MASYPSRRAVLLASATAAACGIDAPSVMAKPAAEGELPVGGVNLAGADFGKLPGTHGTEYLYPPRRHFDYFRDLGFMLIRLPFKWERLQPELYAPFAAPEQALLVETVQHATDHGQTLILDPHNYAKRRLASDGWTREHHIGSHEVPVEAFTDFWSRLAHLFKRDARVMFGLMNEPVGLSAEAWLEIANEAVAAIRAAGATNFILVPGTAYSGAHSWHRAGNTVMAGIVDPLDRFAFDVHQYFDENSSGTSPHAVSGTIGSERTEAFQDWARQHGFKAILGEFNGGRNAASYNALHDLCQEMTANADVWIGWAAWAGGPRWPEDEMFTLEPWSDGRMREQTAILARYARPSSQNFWVTDDAVLDLDLARGRFFGAPPDDAFGEALLTLMQERAFTLVVATRGLPASPGAHALMSANGQALLSRAADGAAESAFGGPLRTDAQPLAHWQGKRRLAVTVDREAGRLAIGATGVETVAAYATVPDFREIVGGTGITRVTGFRGARTLDALVA